MSIMVDQKRSYVSHHNIRGLVQDLSEKLDARMVELRLGTPIESVRPFDAKVFMLASREPRSIAKIARALSVSKQAVQASVNRLIEKGVVINESQPENKKEKIVSITTAGEVAKSHVAQLLDELEQELIDKVGKKRLGAFRDVLVDLLD